MFWPPFAICQSRARRACRLSEAVARDNLGPVFPFATSFVFPGRCLQLAFNVELRAFAHVRLPPVKRLLTDAMLAAQLRRRHTSFRLLQNPYYLLFRVTALPHLKSSSSGPHRPNLSENSHFRWTKSRDAAQPEAIRKRVPVLSAIHLAM